MIILKIPVFYRDFLFFCPYSFDPTQPISYLIVKKIILALCILLVFGIGGFFAYKNLFQEKTRNALELVSAEAILVFETYEPVMAWNQMVTQPIWGKLSGIPALQQAEGSLLILDSLVGKSGNLERYLKGNQLSISLHPVGKEEFDFLFILALPPDGDFGLVSQLEKNLGNTVAVSSRNYSNVKVKEYRNKETENELTYARVGNLQILSFTSFLVEDAIRHAQNDALGGFKEKYKELVEALPKPQGLGVLRIGSDGLSIFVNGVTRGPNHSGLDDFFKNKISANLELKFTESRILLEGTTLFGEKNNIGFRANSNNTISYFKDFISNRTAAYFQYQLEDVQQIFSLLETEFSFKSTVMGEIDNVLLKEDFLNDLTGHIGLVYLEKLNQDPQDKLLFIKSKDPQRHLELLKRFSFGPEVNQDVSRFSDNYRSKEILIITTDEFPAHLFNGNFSGFTNTYVALFGDVLVLGNSIKAIKIFMDDFINDNVWSKSLKHKKTLEDLSSGTVYNFVLDIPRFWPNILDASSPNWKSFFQKYASQFQAIDKTFLNLSKVNNQHAVRLELSYNLSEPKLDQQVVLVENSSVRFNHKLIFGPKSIQNFNDRSIEFVVQDELNWIHLITNEGESVFSYELDGPVISEIFQFDYYKNNKLQLLFATKNFIYAIDRFGNLLPDFPIRFSQGRISHLNLLDYDNNRDYRFFISTLEGDLYLSDKSGNVLEGWNPKKINASLSVKPTHHRIPGIGDRMLALAKSGELYLFNRRGDTELGSPIRLGESLETDYVLLERGGAKETRLVTVTKTGEIVMVNFLGEITYRNQLMKPDRETVFHLIKDQKDDRYVFAVHEYNKVSVIDSDTNVLFTKDIFSDSLKFQFFSFGSDKNIFAILDQNQEFIFLYNLKGDLLTARPIDGNQELEIKYSAAQNEYIIYVVSNNKFSEYRLPL
jgi:hypothetical protein